MTDGQWFFPEKCLIGGSFHVKWPKPGYDPSQSLIKICQVVTIYKIWYSWKLHLIMLHGLGDRRNRSSKLARPDLKLQNLGFKVNLNDI